MLYFNVLEVEERRATRWIRKHVAKCAQAKAYKAERGPLPVTEFLSYVFKRTAIGVAVAARCDCCKNEVDVTDHTRW